MNWDPLGGNLIFVISQPRAGSTLLQKILGSHSAIHTVSEPWIALHPLFGLREIGIATNYGARLTLSAVEEFLRQIPEGHAAYWEGVRRMLGHLYSRVLEESGKSLFLDKTPRYYFILRELREVFPCARFIFLLRNPVAVLASVIDTWAADDSLEDLRLFRHDLAVAPREIAAALADPPRRHTVIRYEDYAADPHPALERLCGFLGLPFEPAMIDYGSSPAGHKPFLYGDTGTVYRQRRPIPSRIDRWRSTLASPLRKAWAHGYVDALGPDIFATLGYDYDEMARAFPAQPGFDRAWDEVVRTAADHRIALETARPT